MKYIETIPRRGYRFVAPVDEVREVSSPRAIESNPAVSQNRDSLDTMTTRFLAVLPFVNVSNDADTEYLSDGITESIINSLAPLQV